VLERQTELLNAIILQLTHTSSTATTIRQKNARKRLKKFHGKKVCAVTGVSNSLRAAHIIPRRMAEQERFSVTTNEVDSPRNMIFLHGELEKALDDFHWTFDANGSVKVLFARSKVAEIFKFNNYQITLADEKKGGPRVNYITRAYEYAVEHAKLRCPDCYAVRPSEDTMTRHRALSCPFRQLFDDDDDDDDDDDAENARNSSNESKSEASAAKSSSACSTNSEHKE
jgi:hypothetical protein